MAPVLALLAAGCEGDDRVARGGPPPDPASVALDADDADTARVVFNDYLCTLPVLPEEEPAAVAGGATEDPADTIGGSAAPPPGAWQRDAALRLSRRWSVGKQLRVRFMNGDPLLQERVFNTALEWTKHANVRFVRSGDADAEIRIAFTTDSASWSFLGTDAERRPLDKHTMQFGWLDASSTPATVRAVVLHEFGHALGLVHEHQQPGSSIPWDRRKVYKHYGAMRPPWSKKQVDEHVFKRHSARETQYSEWDPRSIMQYPVPNSLTVGDFEVGWNAQLSPTDIRYIGCWYHRGDKPGKDCSSTT
ncbi:MAG TPA: M12 family metallopeptidase [Longimicrobiaceae bacterium]